MELFSCLNLQATISLFLPEFEPYAKNFPPCYIPGAQIHIMNLVDMWRKEVNKKRWLCGRERSNACFRTLLWFDAPPRSVCSKGWSPLRHVRWSLREGLKGLRWVGHAMNETVGPWTCLVSLPLWSWLCHTLQPWCAALTRGIKWYVHVIPDWGLHSHEPK